MLVDALVVADPVEQVGESVEAGVVGGKKRCRRIGHPTRGLFHQVSILVLGVVLEFGVELIASGRADHVEKPGQLVIDECQRLGNDGEFTRPSHIPCLAISSSRISKCNYSLSCWARLSVTRSTTRRAKSGRLEVWVIAMWATCSQDW